MRRAVTVGHFPKLPKTSDPRRCSLRPRVARPRVNRARVAEDRKSVRRRRRAAESAAAARWAVSRNVSFCLAVADRLGTGAWPDQSLGAAAYSGCDMSEDVRRCPIASNALTGGGAGIMSTAIDFRIGRQVGGLALSDSLRAGRLFRSRSVRGA